MKIVELIRPRWMLGTLLIVAAALFSIGAAREGLAHSDTVTTVRSAADDGGTERDEGASHDERGEAASGETTILGIDLESTQLVVLAVTISLVLAAATWRTDRKLVLLAAALFAAAFTALDVAEVAHQISGSPSAAARPVALASRAGR